MPRSLLAYAVVVAILGTACGGGSTTAPTEPEDPVPDESQTLRADLLAAGLEPVPAPPEVSDELFELGQALFFDEILSGNEDVSCATCHLPQFGTSDGRTLSDGVHGIGVGPNRSGGVIIPRNSPPLFALHLRRNLFWDGRILTLGGNVSLPRAVLLSLEMRSVFSPGFEALAAQAMLPPVSREEMRGMAGENDLGDLGDGYNSINGTPQGTADVWVELTERLLDLPGYRSLFAAAYPDVSVDDINFAHAGNAIAAFETRAFARTDSPFDRFLQGDDEALTPEQKEGAFEFLRAGCADCHTGPLLADSAFHNTGLPQIGPGLNGPVLTNPVVAGGPDFGLENVTHSSNHRFQFRTASLLNVELTAPYGHAGQFEDLRDFVAHYRDPGLSNLNYDYLSNVQDPRLVDMRVQNSPQVLARLDPLLETRNDFDVDAVVTFLHSLTADSARDLSGIVPTSVPSNLQDVHFR